MRAGILIKLFRELMKDVYTQVPGHVTGFDPVKQLAQVQIGISSETALGEIVTPGAIIECPVHFSGGGGWSVDHKLSPGNEGMISFSQRCIDGWRQTGGVATNPVARFHDKNDAFFTPGFRSNNNAITDFQNNGIRLRNADASVYFWLKDDGSIDIKSVGDVNINGATISPTGLITDSTGVQQNTHTHTQGNDSSGDTQVPTSPPTVI